jgi:hypothetical protein
MKLYPINYDCSKDKVISTRDIDVQAAIPLAKEWLKTAITKGIEKDDLIRMVEKQFPILITSEVISLVIDPLIGVDLKYNDSSISSPIKEGVKVLSIKKKVNKVATTK